MNLNDFSKEDLLHFFETLFKIRRFEEEVFEFYKQGLMPGLAHLYLGQEAIATGVCYCVAKDDYIGSHHRGHGHLIARNADAKRMMAEILGKKSGYSKGKGGSMHIMAMDKGILGANGIIGAGVPIATGAAYSSLYRGTDQVTICFLGDAAANAGSFHESLNMAAAWKLPIVYIIENNLYGISVDIRDVTNTVDLAVRAKAYDIPGVVADGMDVTAVVKTTKPALEHARKGNGPTLIEFKTYRWQGHHVGDPATYRARRDPEEKAYWMSRCPVKCFKDELLKSNKVSVNEIKSIEEKINNEILEAVEFAKNDEYPDISEAYTDVFVDSTI